MTSSSGFSSWYTSTAQSGPSGPFLPIEHSPSNLLFFFRPLCIFSLCTLTTALCSWLFIFTSCFFFPSLTPSGFFNGMPGVSEPRALNSYTLFRLIPLTLFVSRNLTLIYLPFFWIPGSSALRSDCSHSRSGIFSTYVTNASSGVIIFVMQGLSFSKLSTSSLSLLNPYSDYVEVNI